MTWRARAWGAGCLALLGCNADDSFICAEDSQCLSNGVEGACEASGYCSFPDDGCPSGRRYGDAAGGGVAGSCVNLPAGSTGQVGTSSSVSSSGEEPTTFATTTTSTPTASTEDGSSGDSSSSSGCPPGSSGCPCYGNSSCDGLLVCDGDGVCTDPMPDCGNGMLDDDEECDDENRADNDGCSAECQLETMCVVTHEGGTPAVVRSWRVARDGTLSQLDSVTLGGDHTPRYDQPREQGLVRCGRRVYGILDDSDAIFGLDVGTDGSLSAAAGLPKLANPQAVLCDEEASILFTFAGTTTIEVRSWSLEDADQLTELDDTTVIFPFVPSFESFLMHPEGGQFYLVASEDSFGGDQAPLHVNRTRYDGAGALSIEQAAVPLGSSAFFLGASIDPAGEFLFVAGYSGTILARTPLAADGAVADNLTNGFFPDGPSATRVLAASGDLVFVSRGGSTNATVSIAQFTAPTVTVQADATAPSVACSMRLLYGEEVLVAGCSYEGGMSTYLLAADLSGLAEVSTDLTMPDTTFQSLAAVACPE